MEPSLDILRAETTRRRLMAMPRAGMAAWAVAATAGLMWLPQAWVIRHPVRLWYAGVRTAGVLAAWLAFPEHSFVAVPRVVVAVHAMTLGVLERRWQVLQRGGAAAASAPVAVASA